ncbi:nuclear transport factor 2 family protein [Acidovorax sp. ST3]|uniref:nuclear transport factor 2 family protein n=1 Tax=Acidovorax sp. ST3 TaxID=2219062 RepID=UPI001EF13767|nr:nuclear transport factor 2 family protein [Acidovorax sp. ST3]
MSKPRQTLAERDSAPASRGDAAVLRFGAMDPTHEHLRRVADALIAATNAFAVEQVLGLFAHDAVIDDPSTGHRFDGHAGIRRYVEQYFVGYQTVTRFLSMQRLGPQRARVRVDFTGDFGHEIGNLDISVDAQGLIARLNADLE